MESVSFKEQFQQKIKQKPLASLFISIAALLTLIWVINYSIKSMTYEKTDDAFIDGHIISVSPRVDGYVVKVFVKDNQQVNEGDLLVELDPNDYRVKLELEEAGLSAAKAFVEQCKAQAAAAEIERDRTEKDFQRYKELNQSNAAVTQQQVDNARAAAFAAAANLDNTVKLIAVAQAKVLQAQAAVDHAKLNLSYTKISAPQAGRLAKKSVEAGELVKAGQPLMSIVKSDVWVVANFKETQLKNMKPGQQVKIKVDAFPNKIFKGHVDSIQAGTGVIFSLLPPENATGNYVKVVQRVPVKIVFDEDPNSLLIMSCGMSVVPEVKVR